MKPRLRDLVTAFAVMAISFAFVAVVMAETCTLELKKLGESRIVSSPTDAIYRFTYPQSFNAQIQSAGKNRIRFGGEEEQAAAFKRIVKKEPEYKSANVFRGLAKFGTQEYAFALDTEPSEAEKEKAEDNDSKSKTDDAKKEAKESKSDSALNKLKDNLLQVLSPTDQPAARMPPKAVTYNRLYFDLNHNGDLTDDKVIESETMPGVVYGGSYSRFQFPRVDITVDVDGTPMDYAFFLTGYANISGDFAYAGVQINAAAYREGDITLDGKKRHIVLIDFNSNGRFDDQIKVSKETVGPNDQIYPTQGDMLLVDPSQSSSAYSSPYEVTSNDYRHYISKLANIDGHYYDLEISPLGDKLTLTPSSLPVGKVTNPNGRFNAVIYGDNGFLKISGDKDAPISVPVGEWKLLSYTIDMTGSPEASKPEEKKEEASKPSGLQALGQVMESLLGNPLTPPRSGRGMTFVTAQATGKYEAVTVSEGQTVALPFGPPYKPTVTAYFTQNGNEKQAQLAMSLVGSAGEICTNMMVAGGRPSKPEFTITDPDEKVVDTGSFEYG